LIGASAPQSVPEIIGFGRGAVVLRPVVRMRMKMETLLLIPCSASKRKQPVKRIAAIDRYDGVFYRVLRKAVREARLPRNVRIRILSARYGLITAATRIPHYEQRMTADRVAELRPLVQASLRRLLRDCNFEDIFINLGHDYLAVLEGAPGLHSAKYATGSIGKRARALKQWIDLARDDGNKSDPPRGSR
jgi:hypothetical protein